MSGVDWEEYWKDFGEAAQKSGFGCELIARTPTGPIEAWTRGDSGPLVYLSAGKIGVEKFFRSVECMPPHETLTIH